MTIEVGEAEISFGMRIMKPFAFAVAKGNLLADNSILLFGSRSLFNIRYQGPEDRSRTLRSPIWNSGLIGFDSHWKSTHVSSHKWSSISGNSLVIASAVVTTPEPVKFPTKDTATGAG